MNKLSLILSAGLRSRLRWARQHIYAWAILTPMVLGITYLSVSRVASNLSTSQLSFSTTLIVAMIFSALLVTLNLSSASAELFHIRRPEFYFEVLPIDTNTHLNVALVARLLRTTIVGLVFLSLKWLLQEPITWRTMLLLLLFVPLVTISELFAALNWIHWGHTKEKRFAIATLLILILSILVAGWLLTLGIESATGGYSHLFPVSLVLVVFLYVATRNYHNRWRAKDIEYARRLQTAGGWRGARIAFWRRRLGPAVAAQLARDLQLTRRGFSSAVYVVVCLSIGILIALVVILTTGIFPPIPTDFGWFDVMRAEPVSVVKIACAVVTTVLVCLVPVLVAYELPFLWLERATGTMGLTMFQAKLAYARFISLPAPLLAFLIGASSGTIPYFYLPLLFLECLLLWWAIASHTGALAYEMPTRPGLALIVMATIGVAGGIGATLALLTSAFVLVGFYFYAQSMHGLSERGRARAKYFLMVGDD